MNVSAGSGAAFFEAPKSLQRTSSGREGFEGLVTRSIDAQEEEKRQQGSAGIAFPNKLTGRERQEVAQLKSQAMEIAARATDGLTPGQLSQIKSIEQKIRDLGGMAMSESLTEAAKQTAEQSRAEQRAADVCEAQTREQTEAFHTADGGRLDLDSHPGMAMLQQKALVTAIRCLPKSSGAMGGIG
jgi:hypothetical protein